MANTSVGHLRDEDIRKYRAHQMIELRVIGTALPEVAAKFNVSTTTVQREIAWYIKHGFLADAESEMLSLTGEALRVFRLRLKANDFKAAQHILEVAVKLGDRFQKQGHQEAELGLRAYMAAKREKDGDKAASAKVVEGSVVRVDQPEYPGTTEETAPETEQRVIPAAPAAPDAEATEPAFELGIRAAEAGSSEGDGLLAPDSQDTFTDLGEDDDEE